MVTFRLTVFPGGFEDLKTVPEGTTLADIQEQYSLGNRGICLNGRRIPAGELTSTQVSCTDTVAALEPSKGNA